MRSKKSTREVLTGTGSTSTSAAPMSDAGAAGGLELHRGDGQVVMIVDDEPLLIELAEGMIIGLGYASLAFSSSARASEAFDSGLKVDLLLTDEDMPGLSGSELVSAIRTKGWDIPVVMMSGNVTTPLKQRARANRVCALISKPFSRELLAATIARCLRDRRQ
jgi:CheY-like chemotaxis protein